jgi:calreticulin
MSKTFVAGLLGCAASVATAEVFFEDTFEKFDTAKWITSGWKSGEMGDFLHTAGEWYADAEAGKGIQTSTDMKHHAISAKLDTPFSNKDKTVVVQFSAKNEKKEYAFCGGGYIKLHPAGIDQAKYGGDDKYNVMFGPDLCGYDISRIHLIFRDHKDENLLKKDEIKLDYDDKNEFTHVYTLILKPDGSFQVLMDQKEKASGTLLEGWDFPPKEIDDPSDTKPDDWVDEEKIADPEDVKPEGWDDIPEKIADPEATKPEEWDDDMDGEWEPATIDNPEYKGEFKPKQIPNPDYVSEVGFYDHESLGFELWTVNNGTIFDNVLVTDDVDYAKTKAEEIVARAEAEKDAKKAYDDAKKPAEENTEEAGDDDAEEAVEDEAPKDEL